MDDEPLPTTHPDATWTKILELDELPEGRVKAVDCGLRRLDRSPVLALTGQVPAGRWTTEGWVGALLTASAFTELAGDAQAARVRAFLEAAYGASRALLAPQGS